MAQLVQTWQEMDLTDKPHCAWEGSFHQLRCHGVDVCVSVCVWKAFIIIELRQCMRHFVALFQSVL